MDVDDSERTLHAMCFSSQYYFACIMHQAGIVLAMLAFEAMVRHAYNPFGDWIAPLVFVIMAGLFFLVGAVRFTMFVYLVIYVAKCSCGSRTLLCNDLQSCLLTA